MIDSSSISILVGALRGSEKTIYKLSLFLILTPVNSYNKPKTKVFMSIFVPVTFDQLYFLTKGLLQVIFEGKVCLVYVKAVLKPYNLHAYIGK